MTALATTISVVSIMAIPITMDTASTLPATLDQVEASLPALSSDLLFGSASGSGASDGGAASDRELSSSDRMLQLLPQTTTITTTML